MLTQQAIIDFCNQYDYDIRKSGNGRWIDQKCAADVVTVVADCIYNYALQDEDGIFTSTEIWHYDYTVENVEAKLVVLTSGHRAFRQHAEYAEGSDTVSTSHAQKSPCAEREKCKWVD